METPNNQNAIDFLQTLVGQPLRYALKSPDTELYDFGFGDEVEVECLSGMRMLNTHILHVLCRFRVIWKNSERKVEKIDTFYEDTPSEEFHSKIKPLIGMEVKRVALSDKNDLWLDFGNVWVVFATFEDGEESWRFFSPHLDLPHLVASDSWLDFSN